MKDEMTGAVYGALEDCNIQEELIRLYNKMASLDPAKPEYAKAQKAFMVLYENKQSLEKELVSEALSQRKINLEERKLDLEGSREEKRMELEERRLGLEERKFEEEMELRKSQLAWDKERSSLDRQAMLTAEGKKSRAAIIAASLGLIGTLVGVGAYVGVNSAVIYGENRKDAFYRSKSLDVKGPKKF